MHIVVTVSKIYVYCLGNSFLVIAIVMLKCQYFVQSFFFVLLFQGEYNLAINDYKRAKSLFCSSDVEAFQRGESMVRPNEEICPNHGVKKFRIDTDNVRNFLQICPTFDVWFSRNGRLYLNIILDFESINLLFILKKHLVFSNWSSSLSIDNA